jgi:hypothetical protein
VTPAPIPPETLAGLHDNVVPQPVSLFPATPAWLVVLAVLLAVLAWGVLRVLQRRRQDRYRRESAAELRGIEARLGSVTTRDAALVELPVLVKRVALHLAARDEVAGLSGLAWLAFLDRTWKGETFATGPGSLLPQIAYGTPARRRAIGSEEMAQLLAVLRSWVREHHAPSSGAQDRDVHERRVQP